ncbi:MAG: MBL fold metallo-hydrolase [Lachnospiraceae bacterium]|nr:MBL fold metallo-hydrolase [Lachnospiraceae bacterium]
MLENISVLFHSSICIHTENQVIYFDPYDISGENHDADLIFITHNHFDHFSPEDIRKIVKQDTCLVLPERINKKVLEKAGLPTEHCIWMGAGQTRQIGGLQVETVAAYNIHKPFHLRKAGWLGYLIIVDDVRIFVAGDTDHHSENEQVITDIALVPIGGMFTMNARQAADYINTIHPQVAIPIHYGKVAGKRSDEDTFADAVEDTIQVSIRMERYQ